VITCRGVAGNGAISTDTQEVSHVLLSLFVESARANVQSLAVRDYKVHKKLAPVYVGVFLPFPLKTLRRMTHD